MEFIDGSTLRQLLPMPLLLDAVEQAYRDVAAGRDRSPIRTQVPVPGGTLVLMPGVRDGGAGETVKLVTVMPDNPTAGRPTIQGVVIWIDGATGEMRYTLDGPTLTAMRTGAASGVGARLLARPDAAVLALIGTGVQAEWQARAVCAARPIREIRVHSRRPEPRDRFADMLAGALDADVRGVDSAEATVRGADIICCATTATSPVFDADWVSPGAHVSGIGSFQLSMVELPPEVFARAVQVAVDDREAALAEAGDLVAALEAGLLPPDGYVEIGTVPSTWAGERPEGAITVFKSVGLAIQDLVAAEAVVTGLASR